MREASPPAPSRYSTGLYIGSIVALSTGLVFFCHERYGWPASWSALGVLALLGALTWWLPSTSSDGRVRFTAASVIVLVAIPIVGPLGAGLVGMTMAVLERRRIPVHRRVFNAAMSSASAMIGGIGYELAGGAFDMAGLQGLVPLTLHVGVPIVVADLATLAANALIVAGVIHLSAGVPLRLQLVDMVASSGLTQFAYGIIAFLVVVMWLPGGMGAVAILVGLAPLAGARWALLQYGEEREARERALGALVAAIETRAPELEGHSARVSSLAGAVAQELGLRPKDVADVRTAGLLHDLGTVVVAPGQEGIDQRRSAALRGVAMLQDLKFLAGASALMEQAANLSPLEAAPTLAAEVVRVTDDYDLLVHADHVDPTAAIDRLRARPSAAENDRVLTAVARAARSDSESAAGAAGPSA